MKIGTLGFRYSTKVKQNELQNKAHLSVLEVVLGLPQMKGKTLLHLALTGSRSKQLSSPDSDYDVKAVVLHSKEDYLLQKVTRSKAFKTEMSNPLGKGNVEVEGNLVDYLTMMNYALASKEPAYDCLFGIPVYETPQSQFLKQLYHKAYNPYLMMTSYTGLLRAEMKKAKTDTLIVRIIIVPFVAATDTHRSQQQAA